MQLGPLTASQGPQLLFEAIAELLILAESRASALFKEMDLPPELSLNYE